MEGIDPGNATDPAIVITDRLQIGILYAFLSLAVVLVLARGVVGAHTAVGRVAIAVIFGILFVVFISGWIAAIRRPARLEVTKDAIRCLQRNGQISSLSRQSGDELGFVQTRRGPRIWRLGLTITGTDAVITLGYFSRHAIREACRARGWRFDDPASIRQRVSKAHG